MKMDTQIILSISILVVIFIMRWLIIRLILYRIMKAEFHSNRKKMIKKLIDFTTIIVIVVLMISIWGIKKSSLITFLTTFFTVSGVVLFAQWSLLSNITSSLILFFYHPIRIRDTIEFSTEHGKQIEGKVIDISYFFIQIRDQENKLFVISTTNVLNKEVRILQTTKRKRTNR